MAQTGLFPTGPSGQPQNVPPKVVQVKQGFISRTDTVTKNLFVLPKFARVLYVMVSGFANSNAGTTAIISAGITGNNALFVNSFDVKATGAQINLFNAQGPAVSYNAGSPALYAGKLATDTTITGIYSETGAASSSGGPWTISVYYTTSEFGEA